MPKGRMINKKISQDSKVAKLSLPATLLYTWCIPYLDVEGRIYGDVWTLKSIVPHIEEITPDVIENCIKEWINADLIIYYGNEQKYIQFKGFLNNQRIDPNKEAKSDIPTPELLQTNSATSKVKLSKVKIISKQEEEANASLDKVYKQGFNIYSLLNKLKKQLNWTKDRKFPPEVITRVCQQYHKDKENIKNDWSWFITVFKRESENHFAEQNQKENVKEGGIESFRDIIKRLGK